MMQSCSPDNVSVRTDEELGALNRSFDLLVSSLGGDRDRVGDAIYGALTGSLLTMKAGTTGTGLSGTGRSEPTVNVLIVPMILEMHGVLA